MSLYSILAVTVVVLGVINCEARSPFVPEPLLAVDYDNRKFYFAGENGFLYAYDVDKSSISLKISMPSDLYPQTVLCRNEKCYVGGRRGLYIYDGSVWQELPDLSNGDVNGLEYCDDALWAATGKGVFRIENGKVIKPYSKNNGLTNTPAFSITCDNKRLFVGTYHVVDGFDMYGNNDINIIDLESGNVDAISFSSTSIMDEGQYAIAINKHSDREKLLVVAWFGWGVNALFELDIPTKKTTQLNNRHFYWFMNLENQYGLNNPSFLADYLAFVDKLRAEAAPIYDNMVGSNDPGDIREYFELTYRVSPSRVVDLYNRSEGRVKSHVGHILREKTDPEIQALFKDKTKN